MSRVISQTEKVKGSLLFIFIVIIIFSFAVFTFNLNILQAWGVVYLELVVLVALEGAWLELLPDGGVKYSIFCTLNKKIL